MPHAPALKRDEATGTLLHRVGTAWLPLEQAETAREAGQLARHRARQLAAEGEPAPCRPGKVVQPSREGAA